MFWKSKNPKTFPTLTALPATSATQYSCSAPAQTPSATTKAGQASLSSTACAVFTAKISFTPKSKNKIPPSKKTPPISPKSKLWAANLGTMSSNTLATMVSLASRPYPKFPASPLPHPFKTSVPTVKKFPTPSSKSRFMIPPPTVSKFSKNPISIFPTAKAF